MKLVIDISEEFYDGLFDESYDPIRNIPLEHIVLVRKIKNGKPLDEVLDEIKAEINTSNRGTCDYFIVDRIEEIIEKHKAESECKR